MPIRSVYFAASAAAGLALFASVLPGSARAAEATRKKTEGCLVKYDAQAATIVVKAKGGGKEETFAVKDGPVLDRTATSVKMDGRGAKLASLEVNRPLIVYWVEDGDKKFAKSVDAPNALDRSTGKPDPDIMEDAGGKPE